MKFVADESFDGPVAEMDAGIEDVDVLALSRRRKLILLTADKDFGDLVCRQGLRHCGVLLVRLSGLEPEEKAEIVAEAIRAHGHSLSGAFSVLTVDSLRIRRV